MDLFGLVRITWLPGEKDAVVAAQPADPPRTEAPGEPPRPPEPSLPPEPPPSERSPGQESPEPPAARIPAGASGPDVLRSLIGLADDVAELSGRDWTAEAAARALRLIQWRVDKVLAECGVEVLADEGLVDPARHEVVGAEPASADAMADRIAATVRRGYLHGDELIRPQQVVAYITTKPAAPAEGNSDAEGD